MKKQLTQFFKRSASLVLLASLNACGSLPGELSAPEIRTSEAHISSQTQSELMLASDVDFILAKIREHDFNSLDENANGKLEADEFPAE